MEDVRCHFWAEDGFHLRGNGDALRLRFRVSHPSGWDAVPFRLTLSASALSDEASIPGDIRFRSVKARQHAMREFLLARTEIMLGPEQWSGSSNYPEPVDAPEKAAQFLDYWNDWVETHLRPVESDLADEFQGLPKDADIASAMHARAAILLTAAERDGRLCPRH
jgi:hypothetical protein